MLIYFFLIYNRSLSKEQEALMLAYAETEKIKGTVNGIVNTAQGKFKTKNVFF